MNRHLALAALLILLALVACSRPAAGPYPAYSPENSDMHGGGDGGSGSM
jgi:hypothetical protein